MEEEQQKNTFFHKVLEFINKIWVKRDTAPKFEHYSKFKEYLQEIEPNSPSYKVASETVELCEEALKIARKRLTYIDRILKLDTQAQELDCYFKLDEKEVVRLKNMLDQFLALTRERNVLMNQLTGFDHSMVHMRYLEDDANEAIPQIQDAEKNQRILRQDIGYIEGERADLEHEFDMLETGIDFISKFSVAMVVMFFGGALILGYRYMIDREPIFVPTTILVLLIMVATVILHLFRKRMKYELRMNIKKQRRAVELLNKKNVVYAYYTNFLNYEYKKYKVRNSGMLKSSIKNFGNYKHVTGRLDNIRKIMYETERQIEKFLRDNNMNEMKFSIEQFAQTVNIEDKIQYCKDVITEKTMLEKKLSDLDTRHGSVWDRIEELNEHDSSDNRIVERIIQTYIDEVGTLLQSIDNDDKAV